MNKKKKQSLGKIVFFIFLTLLCIAVIIWFLFNISDFIGVKKPSTNVANEEKESFTEEQMSDEIEGIQESDRNDLIEEEGTLETDIKGEPEELQEAPNSVEPEDLGSDKESEDAFKNIGVFIYFADENGEYLVGELRYVSRENYLSQSVLELLKGPEAKNLISLIPSSTKLIDIKLENNIARVNFSKGFVEDKIQSDLVDKFVIFSIVNTLTEFDDVIAVEFFIEGSRLEKYGQLDVSESIYRDPLLIKYHE